MLRIKEILDFLTNMKLHTKLFFLECWTSGPILENEGTCVVLLKKAADYQQKRKGK